MGQRLDALPSGSSVMGKAKEFFDKALQHQSDACLLWPYFIAENGYGKIKFRGRMVYAHRHVCGLAHGDPVSPKMDAAHECGNRACVNPRHLRWATRAENIADKRWQGTQTRGACHGPAKLAEDQVLSIMQDPRSHQEIANEFGVSRANIGLIKAGKSWRHLTC